MGFNCGIIGLPNVGKSTLFNALTATAAAEAANYPFCTIEPNIGRVAVPDERLAECARLARSPKIIPTQLEFVDIAGLVRGASAGQGLGNQFLGHIREVDAIAQVLRCFEDENVVHVEGSVDPIRDAETVETELMLADLDSLERRLVAVQKRVRGGARAVVVSAALEAELAHLADAEERREYLSTLGLNETGLDRVIRAGYELLDLITFFTAGPKESRAWTVPRGTKAPQAAGTIHTDFEKGFIRAETIAYQDFLACGGEAGAKDAGKMRLEGADYVVQDGDIMHFRFNL